MLPSLVNNELKNRNTSMWKGKEGEKTKNKTQKKERRRMEEDKQN